ncbi:MAG: MarR family transcriptional regulator [Thermoproteota archaeon]|nr:MarR family transcriptional regulator [Nitrosopumilus sp.]MDQ3084530.1 MarR family transcriptional regulator [Thermoproteota archaeon]
MSSNNNFNESPNHFMVLDAISRGMKKIDSIAKVTKLSRDEVELILNDLKNQKLINTVVKKGFFGNKKTEYHASDTGMRMLDSKKQELSDKSQQLQQLYETGNRGQVQSFMDSNRMWMPMMLFSGIMSMVMFASMMSFMGMAMNPAESAQTEGQVDESGGSAAEDTGGAASDTGASDTADTGSFSDTGAGGGMDTGGFDSF